MIIEQMESTPFDKVCLGGTFDHLHQGHKELLKMAFKMGNYVSIGLATDCMLKSKEYYNQIQDYEKREKNLRYYIENRLKISSNFYAIMPLNDGLGPTVKETKIDAIVCSQETYKGCLRINEMRIKQGFTPLVIIIIPIYLNKLGKKLSSTDIRAELLQIEVDFK